MNDKKSIIPNANINLILDLENVEDYIEFLKLVQKLNMNKLKFHYLLTTLVSLLKKYFY